jgi:hypothetical protein
MTIFVKGENSMTFGPLTSAYHPKELYPSRHQRNHHYHYGSSSAFQPDPISIKHPNHHNRDLWVASCKKQEISVEGVQ